MFPEALTLAGAALVVPIVGAVKGLLPDGFSGRATLAVTLGAGIVIGGLLHAAGFIDTSGFTTTQMFARAVLAGLNIALAASGARSWAEWP